MHLLMTAFSLQNAEEIRIGASYSPCVDLKANTC
jgi:hypothetical protein